MEQNRDPMDKNLVRGRPGRTSGPTTAKSIAIKGIVRLNRLELGINVS